MLAWVDIAVLPAYMYVYLYIYIYPIIYYCYYYYYYIVVYIYIYMCPESFRVDGSCSVVGSHNSRGYDRCASQGLLYLVFLLSQPIFPDKIAGCLGEMPQILNAKSVCMLSKVYGDI